MSALESYAQPKVQPSSEAARVAKLLGVRNTTTSLELARRISEGLSPSAATRLATILGRSEVIGPIIPEASWRRARNDKKRLSREMSERLYEVGRVIDAVSRIYHGDTESIVRFLTQPHMLLDNQSPLALARSSSAGTEAVLDLLHKIEYGFPV